MLEKEKNKISMVVPNSIAFRMGIEEGDILLKINNQSLNDIIEYMFLTADEYIELEIRKRNSLIKNYRINKEYDEDLGIIFENPIIDKTKNCMNKCIFCFIDQLPSHLRETLYFKDDDSRLSFLQGNFVTLTNMSDDDIDKIIRYRISPINVSIHTTDHALRVKMLNNKNAGNIYERLMKLCKAGIEINGQIVLCPNINDNEKLDNTIRDLSKLYPGVFSLAVVPVGLTKFRKHLFPLSGYDKASAEEVVDRVEAWQQSLFKRLDTSFVFLSDEFYILSGRCLPKYEEYEEFTQLENGVGLIRKFEHDFFRYLDRLKGVKTSNNEFSIVTGKSAASFMSGICSEIEKKIPGIKINVFAITNVFFGESITVSGLVTGKDIINQLRGCDLGEAVFMPDSMLKAGETVFLDDLSVEDVRDALKVPVVISPVKGEEFIKKIIEHIK